MTTIREYESKRKFFPYTIWSRRIIDFWNSAVIIKSSIRYATSKDARTREDLYIRTIDGIRSGLRSMCDAIRRTDWIGQPVDIIEIPRAESRVWLDYYVFEEIAFETLCANIEFVLDDALVELEAKIIAPIPLDWEYIGIDAETGYQLYYNPEEKNYVSLEESTEQEADYKNEKYFKEVKRNNNLVVIWTGSIETGGGHEPIAIELTAGMIVDEMGRDDIDRKEDEIDRAVRKWVLAKFGEKLSDLVIKIGIEYIATDEITFRIAKGLNLEMDKIKVIAEWRDRSMGEEL